MTGAILILDERDRQRDIEKHSSVHDDGFKDVELARAAASYLLGYIYKNCSSGMLADIARSASDELFPWAESDWKPKDDIRDLVRAGALIAAEIDRLERLVELNFHR